MKLQMLVSAVNQNVDEMAEKMNLEADTLIVNQCDTFAQKSYTYNGNRVEALCLKEKGVGLSRNTLMMRAWGDICLFADDDIVYDRGYADLVIRAFSDHREADMILFNVRVVDSRRTYWNEKDKRIRWYNCGRYPAYSIAVKTESLHRANVSFSLLFGGGAKYSNGEDSLFLRDCLKSGMKIFASPIEIGREEERPSTWFSGYHEKFFTDRGVLYHYLYGKLAMPMTFRFLLAHRKTMCEEIEVRKAFSLMMDGIRSAR